MTLVKIESGIQIPPRAGKSGGHRNETMKDGYPYTSLQVGDSFFSDDISHSGRSGYWAKKLGIKITSRAEGAGRRYWRVS